MKNKKVGFTLSEVLVSVVIIGVIMAISVNSIKIVKASYTSLAYFAFQNVQNMVGVLNSGDSPYGKLKDKDDEELPSMIAQCRNSKGKVVQVLKSDKEYEGYGIANCSSRQNVTGEAKNLFCKSLLSIANISGKTNCENLASVEMKGNEPAIANLDYNKPSFIATNGQRYYISQWTMNPNVSSDFGFRLIAVDLNGTSKPNKMGNDRSSLPPDIVTFMVLDNGEVLPLGVAADNIYLANGRVIMYLNSKVKGYYYTFNESRTENVAPDCTTKIKGVAQKTCNYAVVPLKNEKGTSFFSYRQAYCTATGDEDVAYKNYCVGIGQSELCPPSDDEHVFDLCLPSNVKPMFRYNFRT